MVGSRVAAVARPFVRRRDGMPESISESDWRIFRQLREVALDRFSRRVLEEAARICADTSRGPHERYLELYRLLEARDQSLGRAFDDPRRSRMLWQLAAIRALGVLEDEELAGLSPESRRQVEALAGEALRSRS